MALVGGICSNYTFLYAGLAQMNQGIVPGIYSFGTIFVVCYEVCFLGEDLPIAKVVGMTIIMFSIVMMTLASESDQKEKNYINSVPPI